MYELPDGLKEDIIRSLNAGKDGLSVLDDWLKSVINFGEQMGTDGGHHPMDITASHILQAYENVREIIKLVQTQR